VVSERFSH
jgi:hypothetical protein